MRRDEKVNYESFVKHVLETGEDSPLCPFPFISCECYATRDCTNCEHAKDSFVKWKVQKILDTRKEKRLGSRVFCVACGGGKRTPLLRWHNSYICENCWKILRVIGEDEFLKRIQSNAEDRTITGEDSDHS